MKILGINYSNDAAAAFIRDGVVEAACQEERFRRVKHYAGFPTKAIQFCLDHAGCTLEDLDGVAFFWNPGLVAESPVSRFTSSTRHQLEFLHSVPTQLVSGFPNSGVEAMEQTITFKSGKRLPIHFVTHHLCHAACAFYTSPFEEAAVLTVDGYGERQATVIYKATGKTLEPVLEVDFPHSVGALYAGVTQHMGFNPNGGEGKVMGLASYGEAGQYTDKIRKLVDLTEDGFTLDLKYFEFFHDRPKRYNHRLVELLGEPRSPESAIDKRHEDIAFGLQAVTEEILLHLARLAREKTGMSKLCMAGGVVLNCVANGKIAKESEFDECFFYPAAGDNGTSAGAALWVDHNVFGTDRSFEVASEYLGPEYTTEQIEVSFKNAGVDYHTVDDAVPLAAQMVADGCIIGWFHGRSEFGPRALGNRSIVADPRRAEMKDIINQRVKFREAFRPYAPSACVEHSGEFFDSDVPSPYMLRAYNTRKDKLESLAAITHVDGTARVQTVSKEQNPRYHSLIEAFGKLTGVYVVLNTSFNIRGEPIVNTVEDALRCFFTNGIDALFIDDFVLVKKGMEKYLD